MNEPNAVPSQLPSTSAIKRFIRNTARGIQNDFTTATESLDDFLDKDPQSNPQEAGEAIQIAVRMTEGAKGKLLKLIAFLDNLKAAEIEQTKEARADIAREFEKLKQSIEISNSALEALQ
jgi:hypothetical protein